MCVSLSTDDPSITWPSLSDLAQLLGVKLSTLSRLPAVRCRSTQRIGREVKVPPPDAVAILMERGLGEAVARAGVQDVVERRRERVPALHVVKRTAVPAPPDARLERSSFRGTDPAHLERSDQLATDSTAQRTERRAKLYADLDHRFAGRVIPLERYIYDDNR